MNEKDIVMNGASQILQNNLNKEELLSIIDKIMAKESFDFSRIPIQDGIANFEKECLKRNLNSKPATKKILEELYKRSRR